MSVPNPGSAAFDELLSERRRRRDALDAHLGDRSMVRVRGGLARIWVGLGVDDRQWLNRYHELRAALEEVERVAFAALGVKYPGSSDSEHVAASGE